MQARLFLASAWVSIAIASSSASAQSIYVDFGNLGPPSSSYAAAAEIPGAWNAYTPGTSGAPLVDIFGAPTAATFSATFGCGPGGDEFPTTSGDDELLLDDWHYGDCPFEPSLVTVGGLVAGTYKLYVYPNAGGGSVTGIITLTAGGTVEGGSSVSMPNQPPFPGSYSGWIIGVRTIHLPAASNFVRVQIFSGGTSGMSGMQLVELADATPYCFGDGLDEVVTAECPCGNFGDPGRGCANSNSSLGGAQLSASGTTSPNTLLFTCTGTPNNTLCTFKRGTADLPQGEVFGDGIKCVGGTLIRFGQQNAGQDGNPPNTAVASAGTVPAGNTRYYYMHYRNVSAGFCPPELFNLSNGVRVIW